MTYEDFENTYNDDFKLEHTKIDYILFYDEEHEKYVRASLELFGKSFLLNTYTKEGELWKNVRGTSSVLEYRITKIVDEMISMEIVSNTTIKVYYDAYLIIKIHYEKNNSNHLEEMIKQAEVIKNNVKKYLEDNELVLMINNFLNDIPIHLYVNPSLILQVEAYLIYCNQGYAEKFLLQSDEIKRASFASIETNQVGNRIYEKLALNDGDLVKSYFENGLNLLFELVQERYELDKGMSAYVVYLMINQRIKTILFTEWENEYGDYFYDISNMDLESATSTYFDIDTINHNDVITAGKFIYYLIGNGKFTNNENYLICFDEFLETYNRVEKNHKMNIFKKKLQNNTVANNSITTIDDIDLMNGSEFEQFIAQLFNNMGYKTEVTKHSGDQGIDVIAEKNGTKIGIQAKCYSGSVGNSAIQEAVAGKNYYKLDKVIVVTNSSFTGLAKELANSNDVVLWDRNILKEKIV